MSIQSLPVEILSRIFIQGARPALPSPYLLRPHHRQPLSPEIPTLDFQILISHVCQRWRIIALDTPALWTTLVFLEYRDIERARTLLTRVFPKGCPSAPTTTSTINRSDGPRPVPASRTLTILISTVAQASHIEGVTIAKPEMHKIFWMLRDYLQAWRALHLVVRDFECKAVAREHLGGCGPALSLETLQLYHFEDFRAAQDLYLATYRPPVCVFENTLPRLENVSLIGVNLPWEKSPYLYDGRLRRLELALHADKVRPPYELWERMLRGCGAKLVDVTNGHQITNGERKDEETCMLEELALHYSGPKVGEGETRYAWRSVDDGRVFPSNKQWKRRVWMPRLERLSLTDLDPDYLCKIMETLVLPAVCKLELSLPLPDPDVPEQDFTPFVELLGVKKGEEAVLPPAFTREESISWPASPASESSSSSNMVRTASPQPSVTSVTTRGVSEMTLSGPPSAKLSPDSPNLLDHNDNLYKSVLRRVDAESRTFPALWRVEHLSITALVCSMDSWRGLLRALTGLKTLEIDFGRVGEEFWSILMEEDVSAPRGEAKRPTLLPSLRTVKLSGLEGNKVVQTIQWRSVPPKLGARGEGVRRWLVKWSERMKGRDKVLDELANVGVWINVDGKILHRKVECWDDEDEEEEEEEEEEDAGEVDEEEDEDEDEED